MAARQNATLSLATVELQCLQNSVGSGQGEVAWEPSQAASVYLAMYGRQKKPIMFSNVSNATTNLRFDLCQSHERKANKATQTEAEIKI